MCSMVPLFIPMLRIRLFIIPGPKIPHSRFGAGSESGTFGQGMVKKYISKNLLSENNYPSNFLVKYQRKK